MSVVRRRYRIVTPFIPRVATADTMNAHSAAFERAVSTYCLFGIARACWLETAILPQKRAQNQAVCLNKINNYRLHRFIAFNQRGCRGVDKDSNARVDKGAFATTTKSTAPSSCCCRRKDSRTCRLIRLRSTAFLLTFFDTTRPSRAWPRVFFTA